MAQVGWGKGGLGQASGSAWFRTPTTPRRNALNAPRRAPSTGIDVPAPRSLAVADRRSLSVGSSPGSPSS